MLPSTLKYLYSVESVRMHFPAKQPYCTNDTVCNAAMQHCTQYHLYAAVSRENAFLLVQRNYIPLTKSLFKSAGITVSHFFSMLPSTLKYLYSVEQVEWIFPRNSRVQMTLCAMLHAALHTVSFLHGCFQGKCILTGSTELCPTYKESFQVPWDNSIPLFLHAAIYLEVPLFRWTSQNVFPAKQLRTNDTVCNAACNIAHSIICTQYHLNAAVSRENAFWLVQRNRDTSR